VNAFIGGQLAESEALLEQVMQAGVEDKGCMVFTFLNGEVLAIHHPA